MDKLETLTQKATRDNKIMRLLRVNEIRHIIGHTDKGDFCLTLTKDGKANDYKFVLDAVPVDEKTNKDLLKLLDGVLYTL